MQYSVLAVSALAAVAAAHSNVTYTTLVVDTYTTFCPEATTLTYNSKTYTATASETITVTDCPCTVSKPVTTISAPSTLSVPPVYVNSTTAPVSTPAVKTSVGTTSAVVSATASATPSTITSSGANKAFTLSGFSLAGLLGLAAYVL